MADCVSRLVRLLSSTAERNANRSPHDPTYTNRREPAEGGSQRRLVPCPSSYHHLFMSWHYSLALVEAYSGGNSSGGELSAPSSGTPTHGTFWSPDKTTDASKRSRSGMTYKPSTDAHGEAVLVWCLEASPVRTSPPPAKESASAAPAPVCGSTWRESSVKYCLASSSWKTHRCLWEEDLDWSSVTWPKWGMMRNGVLWERITLAPLTNGTGSGFGANWPSPDARDSQPEGLEVGIRRMEKYSTCGLQTAVRLWATPCAQMANGEPEAFLERKRRSVARGNNMGISLTDLNMQVKAAEKGMWPTPNVPNGGRSTKHVTDWRGKSAYHNGKKVQVGLESAVKASEENGGSLNPAWVEWLMGWPLGWTDCAASATAKFREWCRSHGISIS